MMIVSLDMSLSATGLVVLSPDTTPDPYWAVRTVRTVAPVAPPNPTLAQLRRMEKIVQQLRSSIQELCYGVRPDYGVIEAPAFSKGNGMAHERGGLWWMAYQMLVGLGPAVPVLVVKPNLRAKYATGNGQAGKDEVLLAMSRRYPQVPITNNNEADAAAMAAMAARLYGHPVDNLPRTHLDALKTLVG